jgi:26S proteasome regulatory subunit N9
VDKPGSQDAYVFALTSVARVRLLLEQFTAARADIDKCESVLDTFDSVETIVHAAFYKLSAIYYQSQQEFANFYRTTLLYLACREIDEIPIEEKQVTAHDLCIAALLSDSIYNFGELLLHPILDSLKDTPHKWLRDLLFAFNRGDLQAYNILQSHLEANSLLQEHQQFLYQKISLSALTQLVFSRAPQDRAMTFATISEETKVQLDEIEHLIMKALSLGLLRGSIDQVAEVARISWVQPKVLDRPGIEGMKTRLREWSGGVERLGNWVEGVGKDVWAA